MYVYILATLVMIPQAEMDFVPKAGITLLDLRKIPHKTIAHSLWAENEFLEYLPANTVISLN